MHSHFTLSKCIGLVLLHLTIGVPPKHLALSAAQMGDLTHLFGEKRPSRATFSQTGNGRNHTNELAATDFPLDFVYIMASISKLNAIL